MMEASHMTLPWVIWLNTLRWLATITSQICLTRSIPDIKHQPAITGISISPAISPEVTNLYFKTMELEMLLQSQIA